MFACTGTYESASVWNCATSYRKPFEDNEYGKQPMLGFSLTNAALSSSSAHTKLVTEPHNVQPGYISCKVESLHSANGSTQIRGPSLCYACLLYRTTELHNC